jgi:hypothetical protein
MAGPIAQAIPWLLTSPGSADFPVADAIGDTLPEGVMGLAWF